MYWVEYVAFGVHGVDPYGYCYRQTFGVWFLKHHQFVGADDEEYEGDRQRNMRRILAARQAAIHHDAQEVVRTCRLNRVRANSAYRFGNGEPVQV